MLMPSQTSIEPSQLIPNSLALEYSGDLAEARRVCDQAVQLNDQLPGVKELCEHLSDAP
tara:strand:+ start:46 stop:222 length:177 start_codon:yes stop_codon:yes gene_type:complete